MVHLHWSISTGPASPTTNQDASDEAVYSLAGSLNRDTGDIEQLGPLEHAEAPYSRAGSLNRDTGDIEQLGPLECMQKLHTLELVLSTETREI